MYRDYRSYLNRKVTSTKNCPEKGPMGPPGPQGPPGDGFKCEDGKIDLSCCEIHDVSAIMFCSQDTSGGDSNARIILSGKKKTATGIDVSNVIVIDTSGDLVGTTGGFFVNPIRKKRQNYNLVYDITSKEVTVEKKCWLKFSDRQISSTNLDDTDPKYEYIESEKDMAIYSYRLAYLDNIIQDLSKNPNTRSFKTREQIEPSGNDMPVGVFDEKGKDVITGGVLQIPQDEVNTAFHLSIRTLSSTSSTNKDLVMKPNSNQIYSNTGKYIIGDIINMDKNNFYVLINIRTNHNPSNLLVVFGSP